MYTYLKRLVDERNALTGLMQQMADKAAEDERELSDAEQAQLRGWQERCAAIDTQATEQKNYLESQRSWASLQDQLKAQADAQSEPQPRNGVATRQAEISSWGEVFTRSAAYQSFPGFGTSARVEVDGLLEQRAAIDTNWINVPPYVHAPQLWKMTTPLLDAASRERVSTGAIEWYTFPGSFPLASVVAEGALKPESDITPTLHTASLNTYAHWKGITRQALEDIPRVQAIVENALRGGILLKIEADTAAVLAASTGATGIQDTAGDNMLEGVRVAIGEVQAKGYANPNIILLNPADYASLDIQVMGSTLGGPSQQSSFWGIRTVAVGAVPVNTAYVGDFKSGLTLFDRGQASVYLTDSHADLFLRNTLVVLAETRALPAVTEPSAIQRVVITPAP